MIKYAWILMVLSISFNVISQKRINDFSTWYWMQMRYRFSKKMALNFQYQCRMNENAGQFDKSNFYFSVERKLTKSIQSELLTQLSTDSRHDQFTIYAGMTKKIKFQYFIIFLRSAIQHKRNYFSGFTIIDKPINEWRNRIRIAFPIDEHWTFAVSTEPYLNFSSLSKAYFSRKRSVLTCSYQINKYQSVSTFYLIEPSLNTRFSLKTDFVLGCTYQVVLPRRYKDWRKVVDFKTKNDEQKKERRDTYN